MSRGASPADQGHQDQVEHEGLQPREGRQAGVEAARGVADRRQVHGEGEAPPSSTRSLAGAFNHRTVKEIGTTPDGPKARTERNVGGGIGPDGLTGTTGTAHTTPGGTKAEAKADVKLGPDGIALTGTARSRHRRGSPGTCPCPASTMSSRATRSRTNGKFAVSTRSPTRTGSRSGADGASPAVGHQSAFNVGRSIDVEDYEIRVFDTRRRRRCSAHGRAHVAAETRIVQEGPPRPTTPEDEGRRGPGHLADRHGLPRRFGRHERGERRCHLDRFHDDRPQGREDGREQGPRDAVHRRAGGAQREHQCGRQVRQHQGRVDHEIVLRHLRVRPGHRRRQAGLRDV